jgi:tetratricopeptide (TPR) repeat protein
MKFRNVAAATAATIFFALTSFAQTGAIEGKVTGVDGKPVVGALIKLTRTDIKGDFKTTTNKKGQWIHMGLAVGSTYNISCIVDGKVMDQTMNVRAGLGDPTEASFDLRKRQADNQSRQAAMQKAAETGQIGDDLTRGMTPEQKDALEKQIKAQEAQMKQNKALQDAFSTGMTAKENKQYPEAIAAFEKAAEIGPTQPAVWANLAETYVALAGTKTGADFDAAIAKGLETYAKALSLKADDPAIHSNYARALAMAKKFPEADAEAGKVAELDPAAAGKAYFNLGAILTNVGQPDLAAAAFQKAMTANYADAYYQYGLYLAGKASVDTATGKVTAAPGTVEAFQKYLELAPTGANAQPAKDMIASLGTTIDTSYKNPNAPKNDKKTTTKK